MPPWEHKLSPTATTTCPCFTMAKALWGGLLAPGTRNPGNKAENVYTRFVIKMQRLSSSGVNPCISLDLLRAHAHSLSADWVRELCHAWAMAELSLPPSTHLDTPARACSASAAAGAGAGATFWLCCQRWILASAAQPLSPITLWLPRAGLAAAQCPGSARCSQLQPCPICQKFGEAP